MQTAWMYFFFFFTDPATTEIYTLSLHDALPILDVNRHRERRRCRKRDAGGRYLHGARRGRRHLGQCRRSEEHTSELQSLAYLVCRLLLEKKKCTMQTARKSAVIIVALPADG